MTYHFQIGDDGRTIILPSELAKELGLKPGGDAKGELDGGTLHLTAGMTEERDSLASLREALQGYTLDQFLADRRRDGTA